METPERLIFQIRNTVPFVFETPQDWSAKAEHLHPILKSEMKMDSDFADHVRYFHLCLIAHHTTVATLVPTDVDNLIRLQLWDKKLPTETLEQMAEIVLQSFDWDYRKLSARWVESSISGKRISGHTGECFSTAAAAYAVLRVKSPELAKVVLDKISDEVATHAQVFEELVRSRDGLNVLRAATLIAHNLGDLARVIEMWRVHKDDPIQKLGTDNSWLTCAGEINRVKMAAENHRHYPLRKVRALRRSAEFFIPLGPFFDEWGRKLVRSMALTHEEIAETAEALCDGFERVPGAVGYARALAGIESVFPGGAQNLYLYLPAKIAKKIKAGPIRKVMSIPQASFEQQWSSWALQYCRPYLQ